MDNCGACQIILCLGLWVVTLLPHNCTVISDAPDAVEGYELGSILPFYLHPALLQEDDFVSPDCGPVARSAPIDKFHLGFAEIEMGIMSQTQEKGVTGSHTDHHSCIVWKCLPIPLARLRSSGRDEAMSLIAAHLAAHIHRHTIFGPGLGNVAASRTVVQETSHCYDQFRCSRLSIKIYFAEIISTIILFIRFDTQPRPARKRSARPGARPEAAEQS